MAPPKKITTYVKLQIEAAKATPAPPVGPALGQAQVNIMNVWIIKIQLSLVVIDSIRDHQHHATRGAIVRWPMLRQIGQAEIGAAIGPRRSRRNTEALQHFCAIRR